MVFETDMATVYQIRPRHHNEEVRKRISGDYRGERSTLACTTRSATTITVGPVLSWAVL
jgi:hypothetical protein